MQQFADAREAKEFLVERILSQAERDGVSLSEIERKMLYFSETAWTLPDIMEVNEEFDRRYDQDEYEQKSRNSFVAFGAGQRATKAAGRTGIEPCPLCGTRIIIS